MRSADASRLLSDARSIAGLGPLVAAIGFGGPLVPVGRDLWQTHLADCGARRARLTVGPGLLRALVVEADDDVAARTVAAAMARRLARAAPAPLWLLAITARGGTDVALAVWRADAAGPRIAALVADPRRVLASDAETLCALASTATDAGRTIGGDVLAHTRWHTLLGREALSRRFYRQLESGVRHLASSATGAATPAERGETALLYTSRLLFLAFLETKGWLDGDHAFLRRGFDACMTSGGGHHERVLRALFFGTLNTPWAQRAPAAREFGRVPFLNGGLFAPTPLERRHRGLRFSDAALGAIVVDLLGGYRFTARETRETVGSVSEAAVDPEMLGHAFESLMSAGDRRTTGAFYTPQTLVAHATREALRAALHGAPRAAVDALLDGDAPPDPADAAQLRPRLAALRLLDPACGSGAFLVHALETLAALRARCGDARPIAAIRRDTLTSSIFGVDVNPTAVWLCELRLWLSVVVERDEPDPLRVAPLPNLDHHIRVGDALAVGTSGSGRDPWGGAGGDPTLATLRRRYATTSGARKLAAATVLERAERAAAVAALDRALAMRRVERADLLAAARGRDLFGGRRGSTAAERRRLDELRTLCRTLVGRRRSLLRGGALPFGFAWHFADLAARGGCDIVLGNPPWVRPHALPPAERLALRVGYETCRDAAWSPGAIAARAGRGFGGQVDLAAPFIERSLALVRPGGIVSLLVPAKLWRSLAGGGVRRVLMRDANVRGVDDWSDAPSLFDAAVYPSLIVAERRGGDGGECAARDDDGVAVRQHHTGTPRAWSTPRSSLPLDDTPGSPWLLVPREVRDAIDRLRDAGAPLGTSDAGRLSLGVKCGCNAAFLVHLADDTGDTGDVLRVEGIGPDGATRHGLVERWLLRPVVRGESLHAIDAAARIVWPYDERDRPITALPPNAAGWLAPWRARLAQRTDARRGGPWWALFRTAAARSDAPRVVWADVARALRPRILDAGDDTVPLNSCYVLRCAGADREADARTVAALLASRVADAWLAALAEPARGGYRRHLAWTVALLPVPRDWARARAILSSPASDLIDRCDDAIADAIADAYGVAPSVLRPLVAWADERRGLIERGGS